MDVTKKLDELYTRAKEHDDAERTRKEEDARYWQSMKAKQEEEDKRKLEEEWPERLRQATIIMNWSREFQNTQLATFLFTKHETIRLYERPGSEKTNWNYVYLCRNGALGWHYFHNKGQSATHTYDNIDQLPDTCLCLC